jgi:hypothetical protein
MAAIRRAGYQAIGYKMLGTRDLRSSRRSHPTNPHKIRADY